MTATSQHKGYPIKWTGSGWSHLDGTPINVKDRCANCGEDSEVCEWGKTTRVEGHVDHKGRPIDVDSCIVRIVKALNDAGLQTVASCCGHGKMPGNIMLADGREIVIMPDYKTCRATEKLMIANGLARPIN